MPAFLSVETVLDIHEDAIELFGGEPGVRELGLLESAVAQAEASFDGAYLHRDLFEMAAAYLFHIAQNHPFIDGNKRAALAAALAFLGCNGVETAREVPALYEVTMAVAEGRIGKVAIGDALRALFT